MKAFPTTVDNGHTENQDGMDLRDYFAAEAMKVEMQTTAKIHENWRYYAAIKCYLMADAMMEAREQE